MRGHIEERRAGVWTVRVELARDPKTGKRRSKATTVYGGRRAAETKRAEMVASMGGMFVPAGVTTLDDIFQIWIASPRKGGKPRAKTSIYHETLRYENHVKPTFGHRDIRTIRPAEISRLYDDLLTQPQHLRQLPLSTGSVLNVHRLLSTMLEWAFRREYIETNPAKKAEVPSNTLPPPSAPSRKAVFALFDYLLESDPYTWAAARLAATVAARRSEVVGLRWKHIDLDNRIIRIEEGLTFVKDVGLITTNTKTGSDAGATLPIDVELSDALSALRKSCEESAAILGVEFSEQWYVFSSDGLGARPWHPDTFTHRIARAVAAVPEAEGVNLKGLRAFVATELEGSGADPTTAQAILRHKSPLTTQRYYKAARQDRVRDATRVLGNSLANREEGDLATAPHTD